MKGEQKAKKGKARFGFFGFSEPHPILSKDSEKYAYAMLCRENIFPTARLDCVPCACAHFLPHSPNSPRNASNRLPSSSPKRATFCRATSGVYIASGCDLEKNLSA